MKASEVVTIEGVVLGQTDKALKFSVPNGLTVWLPSSLIGVIREPGQLDKVRIPAWLAKEKGLV